MGKSPTPSSAIITGIGIIGFGVLYFFTGIFTYRTGFSNRVLTQTENPIRFGFALFVTFAIGAACLIWGLVKIKR